MNKMRKTSIMNRIISIALVFVMAFMLISLDTGIAIADEDHDRANETILYYEHEDTDIEQSADIAILNEEQKTQAEPGEANETVSNEIDENETVDEGTDQAAHNEGSEGSSAADADEVSENSPGPFENSGDENSGDEATGNETTENESSDANDEGQEVPADTASPAYGSISGLLWVDGNGDLDTDWNGIYDENEYPLPEYPVTLYNAEDLSSAVAIAWTGADGRYAFEDLAPGSYVLEIWGENVWGVDYLPPVFITSENKFEIDWSVPGIPAYTDVIELGEGQSVGNVDAGMRLPMGVAPFALVTLANLAKAKVNDTVFIDGFTWVVVKRETVGNGSDAVDAMYLIMRGGVSNNQKFSTDTDYNTSDLRTRFNNYYKTNRWPTMNAIALVPNIGTDHKLTTFLTQPTAVMAMAGSDSKDVYFAPSLRDMEEWAKVNYNGGQIPTGHPLNRNAPQPFPLRFWFRTSRTAAELYGYNRTANVLEGGLHHNGTDGIWDTPAVWVNVGAVDGNVVVHYVDTDNDYIGNPNFIEHTVALGSAFSLQPSDIHEFDGFKYIEWRKGISGSPEDLTEHPNLTKAEVLSIKELYLVYEDDSAHKVKVHYIDDANGAPIVGVPPDVFRVPDGGTFTPDTFPVIPNYRYIGKWRYEYVEANGSLYDSGFNVKDDVKIENVTTDIDVYLYFAWQDTQVEGAEGIKNAYVEGSNEAMNGTANNPVKVEVGDEIRYTITADNNRWTGSSGNNNNGYDVLFLLDWSVSLGSEIVPGLSSRSFIRDAMLEMSDFIFKNYQDSRVAVLVANKNSSNINSTEAYTIIQYETDFLNEVQYTAELPNIHNALNPDPEPYGSQADQANALRAARQKLDGTPNTMYSYGSNTDKPKDIYRRADNSRTPVIVWISDFRMSSSNEYWKNIGTQINTIVTWSTDIVLLSVRLNSKRNVQEGVSTNDSAVEGKIIPAGKSSSWGFTPIGYATPYTEALRAIRNDFLKIADPGKNLGTVITDRVPNGMELGDTPIISHDGEYDPDTRTITWDLAGESANPVTVEFIVTVKEVPKVYRNVASVTFFDGANGSTNATYHETTLRDFVDVTISKTVTGRFSNKTTPFEFKVFIMDENDPGSYSEREFEYTSGVIPGMNAAKQDDGTLTLSDDGDQWAAFSLSHGQTITIHNIPVDALIMVVENDYERYTTTVFDSIDNSVTESRVIDLQPVGYDDRSFDFINEHEGVVPTGINIDSGAIVAFALTAIMLITTGPVVIDYIRKRSRQTRPEK